MSVSQGPDQHGLEPSRSQFLSQSPDKTPPQSLALVAGQDVDEVQFGPVGGIVLPFGASSCQSDNLGGLRF